MFLPFTVVHLCKTQNKIANFIASLCCQSFRFAARSACNCDCSPPINYKWTIVPTELKRKTPMHINRPEPDKMYAFCCRIERQMHTCFGYTIYSNASAKEFSIRCRWLTMHVWKWYDSSRPSAMPLMEDFGSFFFLSFFSSSSSSFL